MTHLTHPPFRHIISISSSLVLGALFLGVGMTLGGCGEEEKKPEPVKKTTRQYTPAPVQARTIDDLKAEFNIDERIEMLEEKSPTSEMERIALLKFFDAWVRGNADEILAVLGTADQAQLRVMMEEGQWQNATGDVIEFVSIQIGPSTSGDTCVLAYYEGLESNQYQLWRYQNDGETVRFEAVATPPGMSDRLSGDDLIAGWWEILDEENALWDLADNEELGDLMAEDDEEEDEKASGGGARRTPGGGMRRTPGGGRRTPGGAP